MAVVRWQIFSASLSVVSFSMIELNTRQKSVHCRMSLEKRGGSSLSLEGGGRASTGVEAE